MSEYLAVDIPWDNEEEVVDREPESTGDGKTHFGFLRLYALKVDKVFEAGHFVTIPGVTGGNFNEKDENDLMKFKGWKPGGNQWLFVLVATKKDQSGNSYQVVKQLPGKLPREGDPHLWGDFVYPSLKTLSAVDRDKLTREGSYCQWSEVGTGHKVEIDGKEHEIKVWINFKPFASETAMKTAEDAFWGGRNNGVTPKVELSPYPQSWLNDPSGPQAMINYAKGLTFKDYRELADTLNLFTEKRADGEPFSTDDVKRLISTILDIPQPLIKL